MKEKNLSTPSELQDDADRPASQSAEQQNDDLPDPLRSTVVAWHPYLQAITARVKMARKL